MNNIGYISEREEELTRIQMANHMKIVILQDDIKNGIEVKQEEIDAIILENQRIEAIIESLKDDEDDDDFGMHFYENPEEEENQKLMMEEISKDPNKHYEKMDKMYDKYYEMKKKRKL